jgi:hypothetical protein
MLIAPLPAASGAVLDRVGFVLHTPRTLTPNSIIPGNVDHRQLGLALGRLEIRRQITAAPLLERSPMGQALEAMKARSPADIVFGGYRDFLGREPDSGGYAHYIDLLTERKLTAAQFYRVIIGSPEFRKKHPLPGLTELLDRYLGEE